MKLRENFRTQLFEEISHGGEVKHAALDGGLLSTGKWHFYCRCGTHTHTHPLARNLLHNEFHKLTQIKDTSK